jgi:hypothetical protein
VGRPLNTSEINVDAIHTGAIVFDKPEITEAAIADVLIQENRRA